MKFFIGNSFLFFSFLICIFLHLKLVQCQCNRKWFSKWLHENKKQNTEQKTKKCSFLKVFVHTPRNDNTKTRNIHNTSIKRLLYFEGFNKSSMVYFIQMERKPSHSPGNGSTKTRNITQNRKRRNVHS